MRMQRQIAVTVDRPTWERRIANHGPVFNAHRSGSNLKKIPGEWLTSENFRKGKEFSKE
jgi:hypothetical protein